MRVFAEFRRSWKEENEPGHYETWFLWTYINVLLLKSFSVWSLYQSTVEYLEKKYVFVLTISVGDLRSRSVFILGTNSQIRIVYQLYQKWWRVDILL